MFRPWPCASVVVALVVAVVPAPAQEGGLDILEGPTIFADGTLITISEVYRRRSVTYSGSSEVADPADREREDHRLTFGLQYGLTPELTVTALLPFHFREQESTASGVRDTVRSEGLGDCSLILKYRLFKRDWDLNTFAVSLIGGVETPTGSTSETDSGGLLAPGLQPGSGSWDGVFAAATTLQLDRWKFNAIVLQQLQGEGSRDHTFGDTTVVEVSAGNRFWIDKYPGPSMNGGLGIQFRHDEPNEINGADVANSGGDFVTLKPSLVYHPKPWWDLVLTGEVPIYRDVEGTQLVSDFGVFFAIGYRF